MCAWQAVVEQGGAAMRATSKQVATQARAAGYEVVAIEQLRTNRWVLVLRDNAGVSSIMLVQQRPLVGAADVQDLAELLRLHHSSDGILLALDGTFSPVAHRTALELR